MLAVSTTTIQVTSIMSTLILAVLAAYVGYTAYRVYDTTKAIQTEAARVAAALVVTQKKEATERKEIATDLAERIADGSTTT